MSTDGGPAFPCAGRGYNPYAEPEAPYYFDGMTLRDYFAGQALVGILRAAGTISIDPDLGSREARLAYAMADAMLKERTSE